MTWWPFKRKQLQEPEITVAELADMWIEAHRKSQQRFYDLLAESGSEPSVEMLERDRARMNAVTKEAQKYVRTHI